MSDGRKNERFDLELPVRLRIRGDGGETESGTRNISASGALISSRLPLPEGTTLEIDIDIPLEVLAGIENASVSLKGRVVRVTDEDTALSFDRDGDNPCDSDSQSGEALTLRQKEILRLISRGLSNREIADRLFISPHTVKTHLQHIFSKIKVKQRLQAALWAAKHL